VIEQALGEFGRFDILVNNAGILRDRMNFNMDEEGWLGRRHPCTPTGPRHPCCAPRHDTGDPERKSAGASSGRVINVIVNVSAPRVRTRMVEHAWQDDGDDSPATCGRS